MNSKLIRRTDGTYAEQLAEIWMAEYTEDPATGLWQTEVFKHDVAEWRGQGFGSLEDARQAAQAYYDQV